MAAQEERKARLEQRKDNARHKLDYGDLKVSRRIPEEIAAAVVERDRGRDFGRPNHQCEKPGPPHHITHFEKFEKGEVEGNPHTPENLKAPCAECHKLAHALKIPSGVSTRDFFLEQFGDGEE
jgi:hypothetical protein